MPFISLTRARAVLRSSLWVVPAACVVTSVGAGLGLLELDEHVVSNRIAFLFPGPPSGARALLTAIVQAMIAFTGLVFSITIVVLQLSSGQFSPRVLRTFLRDRTIQWALGVFIATFVYAVIVLRGVEPVGAEPRYVPQAAVTGAFLLVLLSVLLFIAYISHVTNLIRVATIIELIRTEAANVIERQCSPDHPDPPALEVTAAIETLPSPRTGVVVSINEAALVAAARRTRHIYTVVPRVGDFVPHGAPLVEVHADGSGTSAPSSPESHNVLRAIAVDSERTTDQDLAFSFRQLVDIAERALSPSMNDPTTATQVVDALHDLLRRVASRELPHGRLLDQDGRLRLIVPQYTFADLLDLSVAEIWQYGQDTVQLPPRLRRMLLDLRYVALPAHQDPIQRWLRRLDQA